MQVRDNFVLFKQRSNSDSLKFCSWAPQQYFIRLELSNFSLTLNSLHLCGSSLTRCTG